MAKTATRKSATKPKVKTKAKAKAKSKPRKAAQPKKAAPRKLTGGTARAQSGDSAADVFANLLQSPLAADLVAVAATAALAALAEHGFSGRSGAHKTAGKAVKEAGKAAAAAVGRRLTNELDAIREAAKAKKGA